MASKPLLSFLDYQVESVDIQPVSTFTPHEPRRAKIETSFAVGRDDEQTEKFLIIMACRHFADSPEHNLPYTVVIKLNGEFASGINLPPDSIPATVAANALSLLYGVARGIVGQITAGGVNGRFVLPTITFDEVVTRATQGEDSGVVADPPDFLRRLSSEAGSAIHSPQKSRRGAARRAKE